jgi:AcrR family transcriptional regulator
MMRALSQSIRDRRRERIVQAATQVFFAEGYAATTMAAVAARLGGSKGTLYAYFPSKEDLFEAIIRGQCDRISAALDQAEGLGDVREQLSHLGLAFMRALVSEAGVRTLQLAIEASRNNPALAWRFEEISIRVLTARLIAFLQQANARGALGADDPAAAANAFVTLMRGDLHFRRLLNLIPEPSEDALRAEVAEAVDVFLKAFGKDRRGHSRAAGGR